MPNLSVQTPLAVGMTFDSMSPPSKKDHSGAAVYLITNTANGKIYVGSAIRFWHRFGGHKGAPPKNKTQIVRAMRKYGFDAFQFEILEVVEQPNKELVLAREQYWLDTLQPFSPKGYNTLPRAGSPLGMKLSDEAKNKIRMAANNRIESIRAQMSKSVYQIDRETITVIAEYSSALEAAKAVKRDGQHATTSSGIGMSCNHVKSAAYGYYWRWKADYDEHGFVPRPVKKRCPNKHIRPVEQLTKSGEIVRTWDSLNAIKLHGWDTKSVSECCNRSNPHRPTAYGFKWRWLDDPDQIAAIKARREQDHKEMYA